MARKRAVALALIIAVAGCGGAGEPSGPTAVASSAYRFEVPPGWSVSVSGRTRTASDDGSAVSVTSFRLTRRYARDLWATVVPELDRVAAQLARRLGADVSRKQTAVLAGRRSRLYSFRRGHDGTRRIAFVLEGLHEYQLLCRGNDADACAKLLASFRLR
jgi:hypothetical protein